MRFQKRRLPILVAAIVGILAIAGCSSAGVDTLGPGPDGGPTAVSLGTSGNYVILAKTGISTTGTTAITGDLGVSPQLLVTVTAFPLTSYVVGDSFATSTLVTGKIYASDMTGGTTTADLIAAVNDMVTAYGTAAGLPNPDATELGAGEIGSRVIQPGLYKWGTGVSISNDVTLWGSSTATWVFQIAGNLTVANGVRVKLDGGALAKNIVWQVGSNATLGTTSHFAGTLMTQTLIAVNTGASVDGRLLAQSAVTLIANAITQP